MSIKITKYEAACNLGGCIEEIYQNALLGDFEEKRKKGPQFQFFGTGAPKACAAVH